ncbi:hypothetical protein Rs2_16868 [Raphanus sativus]|nr:hypothetical protein Rs2_16868 [Raphanus sativus]
MCLFLCSHRGVVSMLKIVVVASSPLQLYKESSSNHIQQPYSILFLFAAADVFMKKNKKMTAGVLGLICHHVHQQKSILMIFDAGLWVLWVLGGWFNFLTLAYIGKCLIFSKA